jgi:HEAT repeat protein
VVPEISREFACIRGSNHSCVFAVDLGLVQLDKWVLSGYITLLFSGISRVSKGGEMRDKQRSLILVWVIACISLSLSSGVAVQAQDLKAFMNEQLRLLEDDDLLNDQPAIDALVAKGPAVLDQILGELAGAKRDKKAALIEVIGKVRDPRGFELLKGELDRLGLTRRKAEVFADSYVRIMVIKALGDLGEQRAVPLLLESKNSEDPYEHAQALVALDKLNYKGTFPELEAVAFGSDSNCRNIVVQGLGRKGNTDALPLLVKALNDQVWFVRASAVDALVAVGDPTSVEQLKPLVEDRSPYVRQAVQDGLKKLGQN